MENVKWMLILIIIYIVCDDISCKKQPPIKCQLIDTIEESDPFNRVLEPAFIRTKKCVGGIKVPSRYQCQPIQTEKKELTLFDTHNLKYVNIIKHVPIACGELCVCHSGCSGETPKDGLCEPGLTWDRNSCSCKCKCNVLTQLGRNGNNGKKAKMVSLVHHIVSLAMAVIITLVCVKVVAVCYKETKAYKTHKYRFLPKVKWNKNSKQELEKYTEYVDGPATKDRQSKICCCFLNGEESRGLMECHETTDGENVQSNLTAEECFNIGYIAFKKEKYPEMLKWLKMADGIIQRQAHDSIERIGNEFIILLLEYLSYAYFMTGDLQNAKRYKEQREQMMDHNLTSNVSTGLNGQAAGQTVEQGTSSDTVFDTNDNQ